MRRGTARSCCARHCTAGATAAKWPPTVSSPRDWICFATFSSSVASLHWHSSSDVTSACSRFTHPMSGSLPSSSLRPIGFGQPMRGPDSAPSRGGGGGGEIQLRVMPSSADESSSVAPSPSAQIRTPNASAAAVAASPVSGPAERQHQMMMMRMVDVKPARGGGGGGATSLDDVGGIGIDLEEGHGGGGGGGGGSRSHSSCRNSEEDAVGFTAAELAGGHALAAASASHHSDDMGSLPQRPPVDPRHHRQELQEGKHEHEHEPHHQHHHQHQHQHASHYKQHGAHSGGNRARVDSVPPPHESEKQIRSVPLLDGGSSHLPEGVSTLPPLARIKLETFDELKRKARWKIRGLHAFSATVFVSSKTCQPEAWMEEPVACAS